MDAEQYQDIIDEASSRYKKWNYNNMVGGQASRPEQDFTYWVAQVAYELGCEETSNLWYRSDRDGRM